MTNATFCDIHPDEKTSLIRNKSSVTTLIIQTKVQEVGKDGKKVTWTREAQINACAQCMKDKIYTQAKALNVELEYDEYRLTRDQEGKYHRLNRSVEESEAIETPLAK